MTIWLKVSNDKYELPVAIADTPQALADMVGVTRGTVVTGASKHKNGIKKTLYRKVEVNDQ